MSMDWDSLVTLLLSISFISVSGIQTKVEDVSFVISIGVLRSTDKCVSIRDCCIGDRNSDCCVPLTDCCASGTDNNWFWFCIIPSWLCETARWLISILDVDVSLWHGKILNLSLNDQFAPVESCIGVTDSGCSYIKYIYIYQIYIFIFPHSSGTITEAYSP